MGDAEFAERMRDRWIDDEVETSVVDRLNANWRELIPPSALNVLRHELYKRLGQRFPGARFDATYLRFSDEGSLILTHEAPLYVHAIIDRAVVKACLATTDPPEAIVSMLMELAIDSWKPAPAE